MSERHEQVPDGVDPNTPSAGRMYDYVLGGTEHLPIDRAAAERVREVIPETIDIAWANRGFLQRAVTWLARERGIRQFIDLGAGLPTRNNTHEAAQDGAEEAADSGADSAAGAAEPTRVIYVDNDLMVSRHGEHLLADEPHVTFLHGDMREPEQVLGHPETRALLDFEQPIALVCAAVFHFVSDDARPYDIIGRYLEPMPSGSYLVLSHATEDRNNPAAVQRLRDVYAGANEHAYFRSRDEVARFFDGLELVAPYADAEPGLDYTGMWGSVDQEEADSDGSRWMWCGVARKP